MIDDKTKELSGVIINKIIKKAEMLIHKQTFWVDFAYSIISDELDIDIIYILV
jgi:hypothetical protein